MTGAAVLSCALAACGGAPVVVHLEDWMAIGVEPSEEADRVVATLEAGGWSTTTRLVRDGFVALAFERNEDEFAVRLVTTRGVMVSLDSHQPNGLLRRHGPVRLAGDTAIGDVTGDGRDEIVVTSEHPDGSPCVALLTVARDGRAGAVETEASQLAPDACPGALEDIDGDGQVEVLVELRWPDLAWTPSTVPAIRVPLVLEDNAFRWEGMPATYAQTLRDVLEARLVAARARLDVPEAARVAIELAALANLSGASLASQVHTLDSALAGLVLTERQRTQLSENRRFIARGWTMNGV